MGPSNVRMTKIFVGNVPDGCNSQELRELFEKYGRVLECDVVKHYAFVHMHSDDEAKLAIQGLNGIDYKGIKLSVEASHSKVRQKPGMGGKSSCFRCGQNGHWSKECPRNSSDSFNGRGNGASHPPPHAIMPHAYPSYPPDRFPRYSRYPPPERSYERYTRSYHPYERPPPPPPPPPVPRDDYSFYRHSDYYRRPQPPPPPPPSHVPPHAYSEYTPERRMRVERYDRPYERPLYPSYSSAYASRREAIY